MGSCTMNQITLIQLISRAIKIRMIITMIMILIPIMMMIVIMIIVAMIKITTMSDV